MNCPKTWLLYLHNNAHTSTLEGGEPRSTIVLAPKFKLPSKKCPVDKRLTRSDISCPDMQSYLYSLNPWLPYLSQFITVGFELQDANDLLNVLVHRLDHKISVRNCLAGPCSSTAFQMRDKFDRRDKHGDKLPQLHQPKRMSKRSKMNPAVQRDETATGYN